MYEITQLTQLTALLAPYRGIIFDLDDTLYSEKDYVRSGYRQIAQQYEDSESVYERLWDFFLQRRPAIDDFLAERGENTDSRRQELLDIYRSQVPDIALYPEVPRLLADIKASGRKLGLITDGRVEGQQAKIKALHLERYFDDIVITDALGGSMYRKPNPRAYELLHERWQLPYQELVYIGDNQAKDFIAPAQLGMDAVWFRNADGLYC